MLWSYVYEMQLLVLAFCPIVIARRLDVAQRPLLDTPFKGAAESTANDIALLGRSATIKLFAPSMPQRQPLSDGCKEFLVPFSAITLATDVCLSGDYPLSHNMLISEPPVCSDGSIPKMVYYHDEGCFVNPRFETISKHIPDYCLFGGPAPEKWSLIFRCGPGASTARGADKHQVALPPRSVAVVDSPFAVKPSAINSPTRASDAVIEIGKECDDDATISRPGLAQRIVPVEKCIITMFERVSIIRGATCPDGTRAKLARFHDAACGASQPFSEPELIDILDEHVGVDTCLPSSKDGEKANFMSMVFWCNGVKLDSEAFRKLHGGLVSTEGCEADNKPHLRVASFRKVLPDTCQYVNPEHPRISVAGPGICANGADATLAVYKDQSCGGLPDHFLKIDAEQLMPIGCTSLEGMGAWLWYCDGVKSPAPQLPVSPLIEGKFMNDKCGIATNSPLRYSVQLYARPDTCRTLAHSGLSILRLGVCTNGKPASLALYKDDMCGGTPEHILKLDQRIIENCLFVDSLKGMTSWSFYCEGLQTPPKISIQNASGLKVRPVGLYYVNNCQGGKQQVDALPDQSFKLPAFADTCNEFGPIQDFSIGRPVFCPNGEKARLALFKNEVCDSSAVTFRTVDEDQLDQCIDHEGMGSWAFWCNGPSQLIKDTKSGDLSESIPAANLGYYNLNACQDENQSWFRRPVKPDECKVLEQSRKLSISQSATCADGQKAKLALFRDPFCISSPMFIPKYQDNLNHCIEYGHWTGWAFWCTGQDLGKIKQRETTKARAPTIFVESYNPHTLSIRPISGTIGQSGPKKNAPVPTSHCPSGPVIYTAVPFAGLAKIIEPKLRFSVERSLERLQSIEAQPTDHTSPTGGQLSYAACTFGERPTFLNVPPHFCVPIDPEQPLMITKPGNCSNGLPALVAFYTSGMCQGKPAQYAAVSDARKQCFSFERFTSWEFYCDSESRSPMEFVTSLNTPIKSLNSFGTYNRHVPYEVFLGLVVVGVLACWAVVFAIGVCFASTGSTQESLVSEKEELLEEGLLDKKVSLLQEEVLSKNVELAV